VRPVALIQRKHPVERVGIVVDFDVDKDDDSVNYTIFWVQSEITIVGWREFRLVAA
jgi:hypothetical protein